MNHRFSALLLIGTLLFSQAGFAPTVLAETLPLTPSRVIDASNYSGTGDLQIDNGQNVVVDFSNAPNGLQINGNLVNNGNLFAISTSGQTVASFLAGNITNSQSALLTTILPQAGITGFQNAVNGLNLSLIATNNIVNQGIISSAGDLNLTAGNAVINALPVNSTGTAPLMQAVSNLNIITNLVQNAGQIASLNSNINVATQIAQNLTINNQNGTFSALNLINVRDALFTPKFDTTLLGGDWLSSELNVFSGEGAINIDVNSIQGQASLVGGSSNITTHDGDLHVAMKLSGDPSINSAGNVFLEVSRFDGQWVFADTLSITAGGSIINSDVSQVNAPAISMLAGGGIDLRSEPLEVLSTNGGSLILKAGTAILLPDIPITTSGGSLTIEAGGHVQLPKGEGTQLATNGGAVYINAGTVVLSDVLASSSGHITITSNGTIMGVGSVIDSTAPMTSGNIVLKAGDSIDLSGGALNSGGAFIRMRADGTVLLPQTLSSSGAASAGNIAVVSMQSVIGNDTQVESNSSSGNGGAVTIIAGAQPSFESLNSLYIHGGSGKASTISLNSVHSSGTIGGTINLISFGGGITSNQITSQGGGNVNVIGAGPIEIGSVNTSGGTILENPFAPGNGNINILASNPTIYADKDNFLITAGVFVFNADLLGGFSDRTLSPPPGFVHVPGTLITTNLFLNENGSAPSGASLTANALSSSGGQVFLRAGETIKVAGSINSFSESSQSAVQIMQHFGNGLADAPGISVTDITAYQTIIESNGELTANNLTSKGGGTSLSVNTSNPFVVGSGNVQLVTNIGNAHSGRSGISLSNRSGDVVINQALDQSTISVTNGRPTLNVSAANGIIMPGNITLLSEQRGGEVILSAPTINFIGTTHLQVNGANDNDGGDVSIFSDLLNAPNGITIDANGKGEGWGGFIYAERFNTDSINLSSSFIANALGGESAGGGGNIWLLGAESSPGSILQAHADSGSGGDGGYVYIDASYATNGTLTISQTGALTAAGGGASSGSGGAVEIYTGASLAVTGKAVSVSAGLTGGNGGTIGLYAGLGGVGALTITGDLNANGTGDGTGGSVSLYSPTTIASSTGTTRINANGGTTGSGGAINLTTDQPDGHLVIGGTGSSFLLSADGGSANSSIGDGGTIEVFAGGDLTVNGGNAFHVRALGDSGNGGILTLTAGYRSNSFEFDPETGEFARQFQLGNAESLSVNAGTLAARGAGDGTGGRVELLAPTVSMQNTTTLAADGGELSGGGTVSIKSTNNDVHLGTSTQLFARGGTLSGNGGTVSVESAADLILSGTNINVSSRGDGNGGSVALKATANIMEAASGSISASAASNGSGGTVSVAGSGKVQLLDNVTALGGTSSGDGGTIRIIGNNTTLVEIVGPLQTDARGAGDGGAISIKSLNADAVVSIHDGGNNSQLSSRGGSSSGNGGTVTIETRGTIVADGVVTDVSAQGNGDGGTIDLASVGTLSYGDSLRADGANSGSGGSIYLTSDAEINLGQEENKSLVVARSGIAGGNGGRLEIDGNELNAQTSAISVAARGPIGNGGNASIAISGLSANITSGINADTAGDGNGGNVTINVPNGALTVTGDLDVHVAQNGTGGIISIDPDLESFINGNFLAQVDGSGDAGEAHWFGKGTFHIHNIILRGSGTGNGGRLQMESTAGSIFIGNIITSSTEGDSGSVSLRAPLGSIHVRNINTSSLNSDSGFVKLFAGQEISADTINTNAPTGVAGAVLIRAHQQGGSQPFVIGTNGQLNGIGSIRVQSAKTNTNPTSEDVQSFVAIIDGGTGGISIQNNGAIHMSASNDDAPHLLLDSKGKVTLPVNLVVSTNGDYVGAEIFVQAPEIGSIGENISVSTNGSRGHVALATDLLKVDGNVTLEAGGGTHGGTVDLAPQGAIIYSIDEKSALKPAILQTELNRDFGLSSHITFQGSSLSLDASGKQTGGNAIISSAFVSLQGPAGANTSPGEIRLNASATDSGTGGFASVSASDLELAHNRMQLKTNGAAAGSGGNILYAVTNSGPSIGDATKEVQLIANGGNAEGSTGRAGSITVSNANSITIHGSGISLVAGSNGDGGELEVQAFPAKVNIDGVVNASGRGLGKGGRITISAQEIILGSGTILRADRGASEQNILNSGIIRLNHFSTSDLNLNNSRLLARGGGEVFISSHGKITQGAAGEINVAEGEISSGFITISSSFLETDTTASAINAHLDGFLIASAGKISGSIEFDAAPLEVGQDGAPITITGAANLKGDITANGASVSISTSRPNATLNIGSIISESNVELKATGIGSNIVVLPTQDDAINISAFDGDVSITAASLFVGISKDLSTLSDLSSISISSLSTTLATLPESSGSVRIGGNIESSDFTSISVHGSGSIQTLSEAQITVGPNSSLILNAETGNIGSSDARLRVHTAILEITSQTAYSQTRGAFINSVPQESLQQPLILRSTNIGGMLSIRHVGDIYLGTEDGPIETITVGSADIRSVESAGNITNRAILSSSHNITLQSQGVGAILQGRPDALLQAEQSISITTRNGQIGETHFGGSTEDALRISTSKLSFNVVETGSVSIHSIKAVQLDSSSSISDTRLLVDGNITRTASGVLKAGGSVLIQTTAHGNIGSKASRLQIDTKALSFLSDGSANFHDLKQGGELRIIDSGAKNDINIETLNNLNVERLQSSSGNITLVSQFANISVGENGFIDAFGSITLKASLANSTLSFGEDSEIHSASGPIILQVGNPQLDTVNADASTINNITYEPFGGQIVIPDELTNGQDRILGQGQNIVRAEHSTISLLPGVQSGRIDLNGGVRIAIDGSALQPLPSSPLLPVSFSGTDGIELPSFATTYSAFIWATPSSSLICQRNLLQVNKGDCIIHATKNTIVAVGDVKILMKQKSTVQITLNKNLLIVRCLYDEQAGAASINMGTKKIDLQAGQEAIFGDETQSLNAYRNRRELMISKDKVVIRDFSLLSLYSDGELLSQMKHKNGSAENSLLSKIEKRYVCSQIVHESKEPYVKR